MIKLEKKSNRKSRYEDYRTYEDEICIYFDVLTSKWNYFHGNSSETGSGSSHLSFISFMEELGKQVDDGYKVVCFINSLEKTKHLFSDFPGFCEDIRINKKLGKVTVPKVITDKFEIRNYNSFYTTKDPNKIGNSFKMFEFLRKLANLKDKENITSCKYSVGRVSKQILSCGLEDEIKKFNYEHKNYIDNRDIAEEQTIGSKRGFMEHKSGVYDNCFLIDIKSAYISSFIMLDCFPIGRRSRYFGLRAIRKVCDKRWHHIIVKAPIGSFSDPAFDEYFDEDENAYGFFVFDAAVLEDKGFNITKELFELFDKGFEIIVHSSQEYGRLPKVITDRIMELYELKKETKGTVDGDAYKQITEMIYGKALQDLDFDEIKMSVYTRFSLPENIIFPEYSMIASSYVRKRMHEAFNNMKDPFYADTDGIESFESEESLDYVAEENKKVNKIMESVGYKTDIGTFKIEARNAKVGIIDLKQRFCLDGGNIEIKLCGIEQANIRVLRENNDPEAIFEKLTKEISFYNIGVEYRKDGGFKYYPIKKTLQGCCQEGS